ncbi:MAG: aminotransferase class I/II-fold pyridoxal phosphate-dependent enzyme [Alphaproteobacteria bacterium]|nr:aminotransferase class I/II-fold pyridoxal phosphate-dependent enzyme [Alphaproteobacteria bacterium]
MPNIDIDLYSDTQTRPTPAMREAMASAPVGDEQRGEDPTTNRLCEMVADMLGKEAAVFMPSGTMCNQIAIMVHCQPGDEIIADKTAHIINSEGGGPAVFAGVMLRSIDGERGIFTVEQAEGAIRRARRHAPRTRMIEIEQTANSGGGSIWPLETIRGVGAVAKENDLILHMDGARLLNAVVASGVSARDFAEPFDSLWVDLSKGLGCPVGAVLAGSADFIDQAWQWKQRMGGAMRQSGSIAAAGVHALENHVERMAEDHENAQYFAEAIANLPGIRVEPDRIETNMVFFDVSQTGLTAAELHQKLLQRGVRIGENDQYRMRVVTHLDVTRDQVAKAAETVREVVLEASHAA